MNKTMAESIKYVKDWISQNGTSETLERLLHTMEHEGIFRLDLVPEEILHYFCESEVVPIPMDMVPKLQAAHPEYDWATLAKRGEAILTGLKQSGARVGDLAFSMQEDRTRMFNTMLG